MSPPDEADFDAEPTLSTIDPDEDPDELPVRKDKSPLAELVLSKL